MCAQGYPNGPYEAPVNPIVYRTHPGFGAVAMGEDRDGNAFYTVGARWNLLSAAEQEAMVKCRKRKLNSCQIVYRFKNTHLAVAKASDGGFYFQVGPRKSAAKQNALATCQQRADITCKIEKTYNSMPFTAPG